MTLRNIGLVAAREFLANARTKSFWLGALAVPVLLIGGALVAGFVASLGSVATYAVVDQSGWLHDAARRHIVGRDVASALDDLEDAAPLAGDGRALLAEVQAAIGGDREAFEERAAELIFTLGAESGRIHQPDLLAERFADWWVSDPDAVAEAFGDVSLADYREVVPARRDSGYLNELVDEGTLRGYFVIPDDPVASGEGARYVTSNLANTDLGQWYGRRVTEVVQQQRLREEDIDPATAEWLREPIAFEASKPSAEGIEVAEAGDFIAQWAPTGLVYLLWISIFTSSQMLLTSTIEEKSNRLAEILLSCISPADLMAGKVFGIAATGVTIIAIWVASFLLIALAGFQLAAAGGLDVDSLDLGPLLNPAFLAGFVVYFVFGYLFFGAMFCAIGSLCDSLQDAQSMMTPLVVLLMIPLLVMVPVGRDPSGALAAVMSWIPPMTPFVMLNRMAHPPGAFTFIGTTALMAASVWLMLALAGRIFAGGILRTGKPPSLKQLPSLLRT